jgi:hypothetical protein
MVATISADGSGLYCGSFGEYWAAILTAIRRASSRVTSAFHSWITTPPHLAAMAVFCIPVLFFAKCSPLAGE